ncbi:Processing alpha glucosidase I [Borealophlyctis nickersoniae]|nr:Processing alpha glucosidase I [Borealophlyctis nickersoniae]
MWYVPDTIEDLPSKIRHECRDEDDMAGYTWLKHDGRSFGQQIVRDQRLNVDLETFYLANAAEEGNGWSARIVGRKRLAEFKNQMSVLLYFGIDRSGHIKQKRDSTGSIYYEGFTGDIGSFSIYIRSDNTHAEVHHLGVHMDEGTVWKVKDRVIEHLITRPTGGRSRLGDIVESNANVFVLQLIMHAPFTCDVVLTEKTRKDLNPFLGDHLTSKLQTAAEAFDARFESTFTLSQKNYTQRDIQVAQAALSNLVGGIGYFHGKAIVDRGMVDDKTGLTISNQEREEGPFTLLSAVPSRSFFPRGFLWDEGFHQLLVQSWNADLSRQVIDSWLSLMDTDGWIAREQILGEEARSRVPREFQTQFPHYANPPVLTYPIARFAKDADRPETREWLSVAYGRMIAYYKWLRRTQKGDVERWGRSKKLANGEGYRWRGRQGIHCLTSGLDDYPRPDPPHESELHMDFLAWVGWMARELAEIAGVLGKEKERATLLKDAERVTKSLEVFHWNEEKRLFCDTATYDDGYITLFPLLLGNLPVNSEKVGDVLDVMEELMTGHGLGSLAPSDPLYGTGDNYWRGPIWVNINYLALAGLKNVYASQPGPYRERAEQLYVKLRGDIVKTITAEYERTEFFWEQYDAFDGRGKRSHPFTGWTALVVLIMAEIY